MDDFMNVSLADLKQMAKDLGIAGCSGKKKSELIEILDAYRKEQLASAPEKGSSDAGRGTSGAEKPASDKEKDTSDRKEEQKRTGRSERPSQPVQRERVSEARPQQESGNPVRPSNGATVVRRVVGNMNNRPNPENRGQMNDANMRTRQNRAAEDGSRYNAQQNRAAEDGSRYNAQQNRAAEDGSRYNAQQNRVAEDGNRYNSQPQSDIAQYDSGITKTGILEIPPESAFGFIRNENYLPSADDVYVAPAFIKRYNLSTGDIICGNLKTRSASEKFVALLNITKINGEDPELSVRRKRFDKLTPVFPHERLRLETENGPVSTRIVDLLAPVGKGQRGMIVSPPKAGKTTLLKDIARAIQTNNPKVHMIILLIDERPEEVTDMKDSIKGDNVEIIYSTFDEAPEQHKRVSEMTVEHAKRLVEYGKDVVILLDSITRLARAYNLTCQSSGRTLSGGLDPAALFMPKRFFGAARCMKEGGSLTILATALVDTGSRMDDVVFEEFKGTGNMELTLNRALSERRVFPAIDLPKSSTRREDLLLSPVEQEANLIMRRAFGGARVEEATEQIVNMFTHTRSNAEFIAQIKRTKIFG